jgi:hypothetical protein
MLFNGKRVTSFYKIGNGPGGESPDVINNSDLSIIYLKMETSLKAIIQTYNNCLINNRMTLHIKK